MKKTIFMGVIASTVFLLSACFPEDSSNDDEPVTVVSIGQLALVGGAIHGCSSMSVSDCTDWDSYRSTHLSDLTDDEIRSPIELGVSLTDTKIYDVVDDAAWDADADFDAANEEILFELQDTLTAPDYLFVSWDEFKAAYLEVVTTVTSGSGDFFTGEDVWYNSSDAQWSTLARLELIDDTFQYTVTGEKVDSVLVHTNIAALNAELFNALTITLEDSIYSSPVLQDELTDYFAEVNVVDASVNGWKLFKKYLSDDEFDFMLLTLDPEDDGLFEVTSAAVNTIATDDSVDNNGAGWDEYNQSDLVTVLTFLRTQAGGDVIFPSYSDLRSAITSVYLDSYGDAVTFDYELGSDVWSELSGIEQNIVLQGLVNPLVEFERPIEYVNLAGSEDNDSIRVVNAIVEKSKDDSGSVPKFLIMTSSSNNSYDAVDFYVELFNQAGADAQWLPIDRAYQDARQLERCDLIHAYHGDYASDAHLDLLYPDYAEMHKAACENPQSILDMIADADALFINGGGQRRSLDALMPIINGKRVDSVEMALIRERFEAGDLLVGGTSAGTAVQGGGYLNESANVNPMIDGGQAHDVLRDGYDAGIAVFEGGTGLFNYGITDTHFSERARETRLIKLAQQSDVSLGFGVDETTVLFVDKERVDNKHIAQMTVLGAGGVFISDLSGAAVNSQEGEALEIENVMVHYLNEGDALTLSPVNHELVVTLAGEVVSTDVNAGQVTNDDVLYQDGFRSMMAEVVKSGAISALGTSYENDPTMLVSIGRSNLTSAAVANEKASYTNVLMAISPQ
jgi:cyanophycinase